MATNRKRTPRSRKGISLDDSIKECLLYGTAERGTPGWEIRVDRFFGGDKIRAAWGEHKSMLLSEWEKKHPGERPWAEKY